MFIRDAEYIIFDVETTGLSPQAGDRIIEIAAVKIKKMEVIDTFESFINPERNIPLQAQQINHISEEMVVDAPVSADILPQFIEFISGGCLVGHNVRFDLGFLCNELALAGRKLNDQTPALDTLKIAKKFLPCLSSYSLGFIAQSLGVRVGDDAHRALADVLVTSKILKHLVGIAEEHDVTAFSQFHKDFGVQKPSFPIVSAVQNSLF